MKSYSMTMQMKATRSKQYFSVVMFIIYFMRCSKSVDKNLQCDY